MPLPLANRYARVRALQAKLEARRRDLEKEILESQDKNGCVAGHNLMIFVKSIDRVDYSVAVLKEYASQKVLYKARRVSQYNRFDIKPIEEQKVA